MLTPPGRSRECRRGGHPLLFGRAGEEGSGLGGGGAPAPDPERGRGGTIPIPERRPSLAGTEEPGAGAVGDGWWAMGSGQWAISHGLWAVGSRRWVVGHEPWAASGGRLAPCPPLPAQAVQRARQSKLGVRREVKMKI